MVAYHNTRKSNLRWTFGIVAAIFAVGIVWLTFFGGSGPSTDGGQDFISPIASPLASIGAGFQDQDSMVMASVTAASMANAGIISGSRDNVLVLALAGLAASIFAILVFVSGAGLRFRGFSLIQMRTHIRSRQATRA
ncbi:MAG: hypothetical protein BZY75_01925 [SAR202 cluster bacterium Io17-Chloro-G7]|nr:MAG: hypothetical protein BZY75_01925 [SAR202 cluster bacterium Io17-Chloro-G7]